MLQLARVVGYKVPARDLMKALQILSSHTILNTRRGFNLIEKLVPLGHGKVRSRGSCFGFRFLRARRGVCAAERIFGRLVSRCGQNGARNTLIVASILRELPVYTQKCVTPVQRNFLPRRLRASPLRFGRHCSMGWGGCPTKDAQECVLPRRLHGLVPTFRPALFGVEGGCPVSRAPIDFAGHR